MTNKTALQQRIRFLLVFLSGAVLWLIPQPSGLSPQAWHLFIIFLAAILCILIRALPILTASLLAMTLAILTRTLTAVQAFSGFGQDFLS